MTQPSQNLEASFSTTGDGVLADLLEEIASRLRSGETVSLDDFATRYPEHEADLRTLYPTVAAMVEMVEETSRYSPSHDSLESHSLVDGTNPQHLGDFQLIREVGRGGMGVVYEAEQVSLRRRVAVKVLPFAGMLDDRWLKRFQNEARSAATLDHPNIVSVHFIGCERGIHFFAMQFIDGVTLEEVVQRLKLEAAQRSSPALREVGRGETSRNPAIVPVHVPASSEDVTASFGMGNSMYRRIAQLAADAADAVEHAHQQRIVHRDIKPSNLMLDEQGQIWVTDFGLATTHGEGNLTLTGDRIGTLRYSSPEQSRGGAIDHRTDIYSLGVTLYELLALRPAFPTQDRQVLLDQILHHEPRRLRQVKNDVPRDLEVIVHKAIAKDPQERYQTAREFAEDLRRFLRHQPIKAKPPALWESAARWVRRRPGVALVAVLAAVAAVATSIVLSAYTVQLRVANARLEELNDESLLRESQFHRSLQYPSSIAVAAGAIQQRDFETAWQALAACIPSKPGIANPCGFEWYLLQNRVRPPQLLWTFSGTGTPLMSVSISPDGNYAATGDKLGIVSLWDLKTGKRCKSWRPFAGETRVQFSPRGSWLAAASDYRDGRVILWTMQDFKEAANFVAHDGTLYALAFSPDEQHLATGGREENIRLWNVADVISAKKQSSPPVPVWQVEAASVIYELQFGPDGTWLISAEKQERLRTWNTSNGSIRSTICQAEHDNSFQGCALLKQGTMCAAGGYSDFLRLYDLAGKRSIAAFDCGDGIYDVAVSPNQQLVAVGCDDGSVILWQFSGADLRQVERISYVAHRGRVRRVVFSPDGSSLLTASDDGTAKVWSLTGLPAPDVRLTDLHRPAGFDQLRCDPTGTRLALAGPEGTLQILDAESGNAIADLTIPQKPLANPCFDPAGGRIVATSGNEVHLWKTAGWTLERSWTSPGPPIRCAAFGKTGRLELFTSPSEDTGSLEERSLPDGKLIRTVNLGKHVPETVLRSPTGELLAVSTGEASLLLIQLETAEVREVHLPNDRMLHLAFSRDGQRLAAANNGNTFCLVNVPDAKMISYHGISASDISGLAFTDEGRLLAISDHEQKCVHFWDQDTTRALFSLDALRLEPCSLLLSPDGRYLLAATRASSPEGVSGVLRWDLKP